MAMDIVDVVVGGFWSKVSGGLKSVVKFVGDSGIAKQVGNKVLVSTTSGAAGIEALAPATQLMEKAIAGDEKAKEMVAALAQKADGGDKLAKNAMGVLDIAAAGLRAAEQKAEVAVGAGKTTVIQKSGKPVTFKDLATAKAFVAANPGSRLVGAPRRPGQPARPGQPRRPGQPARPQPRRPGSQLVNRQQIAQSMQGMTPQQQQVFQQNLLAQQQQNLQSGMLQGYDQYGQPIGTSGYGYPSTGYPQPTGYPGGYAVPMQQGFPGSYVQQEYFADEPPPELMQTSEPGDVEIEDEGESE